MQYIKEQSPERKFEIKIYVIFSFLLPKMGKTVFDLYKAQIKLFMNFFSVVALL